MGQYRGAISKVKGLTSAILTGLVLTVAGFALALVAVLAVLTVAGAIIGAQGPRQP